MRFVYEIPFLQALGWSLADSLWQTGLLWLAYTLLTGNGRKWKASSRYNLALGLLALGNIWWIAGLFQYYSGIRSGAAPLGLPQSAFRWISAELPVLIGQLPASINPFPGGRIGEWQAPAALVSVSAYETMTNLSGALIALLYGAGLLLHTIRLVMRYRTGKQLNGLSPLETGFPGLQQMTDRLAAKIALDKPVRLLISRSLSSPLTLGIVKPVILLPLAAITRLSPRQLEAVLTHELIHIRRNDYLVNLLLQINGLLLFFNPFTRLLQGIIRKERENACDDAVIKQQFSGVEYAEALYLLGRNELAPQRLALAATGDDKKLLLQRVNRILNRRQSFPSLLRPASGLLLCLLAMALLQPPRQQPPSLIGPSTPYDNIPHPATPQAATETISAADSRIGISLPAGRSNPSGDPGIPPVSGSETPTGNNRIDVSAATSQAAQGNTPGSTPQAPREAVPSADTRNDIAQTAGGTGPLTVSVNYDWKAAQPDKSQEYTFTAPGPAAGKTAPGDNRKDIPQTTTQTLKIVFTPSAPAAVELLPGPVEEAPTHPQPAAKTLLMTADTITINTEYVAHARLAILSPNETFTLTPAVTIIHLPEASVINSEPMPYVPNAVFYYNPTLDSLRMYSITDSTKQPRPALPGTPRKTIRL